MNWRLASRLSVVTLAVFIVALVALLGSRAGRPAAGLLAPSTQAVNTSGLQGADLGGVPAPDFRLIDQAGQQVTLSQFRGKPVILTFLYTHCPDLCPLTAEKLHAVMLSLGNDAQRVAVLAVSTDPTGDTIAAAVNFSKVHKMLDYWHFLVGTHAALSPVWASYSVFAAPIPTPTTSTGGSVSHTTAIFVIDKQGRERVYLGNDFTPAQLTIDLQLLLKE